MSLPQMLEARTLIRTCPGPGSGMGYSSNSTVLLPGSTTPCIISAIVAVSCL